MLNLCRDRTLAKDRSSSGVSSRRLLDTSEVKMKEEDLIHTEWPLWVRGLSGLKYDILYLLLLSKKGPSLTQFIEKNTGLLGDYSFARITQHKAMWTGDGQARIPTLVTSALSCHHSETKTEKFLDLDLVLKELQPV